MDICSTNGLLPANSNIIDCIKSDKYKKNDLITKPNLISDRFIYLQSYLFLKHKLTHTVCRTKDYGTKAIFYLQHFHSSQNERSPLPPDYKDSNVAFDLTPTDKSPSQDNTYCLPSITLVIATLLTSVNKLQLLALFNSIMFPHTKR